MNIRPINDYIGRASAVHDFDAAIVLCKDETDYDEKMKGKLERYFTVPIVAFVGLSGVPQDFLQKNPNAKCYSLDEFDEMKKTL
jgi:hypothetical protein